MNPSTTLTTYILMIAALQVTANALQCLGYAGVGLDYWDDLHMPINCSEQARCQLIVEPLEEPMGFTADCSDTWSTALADCWNECRTDVEVMGWVYKELCSYCCDTPRCNVPQEFTYTPKESSSFPGSGSSRNGQTVSAWTFLFVGASFWILDGMC